MNQNLATINPGGGWASLEYGVFFLRPIRTAPARLRIIALLAECHGIGETWSLRLSMDDPVRFGQLSGLFAPSSYVVAAFGVLYELWRRLQELTVPYGPEPCDMARGVDFRAAPIRKLARSQGSRASTPVRDTADQRAAMIDLVRSGRRKPLRRRLILAVALHRSRRGRCRCGPRAERSRRRQPARQSELMSQKDPPMR